MYSSNRDVSVSDNSNTAGAEKIVKIVVVPWFLINAVGLAAATHCYHCSTTDGSNNDCENEFNYVENSSVKVDENCDQYCIKHEVRVSTLIPNYYRPHAITRTCGAACFNMCTEVNGIQTCIYCCLEDFCNGSYRRPCYLVNLLPLLMISLANGFLS